MLRDAMNIDAERLDEAIRSLSGRYNGFGGNCAAFAIYLNEALGWIGSYICFDGDHYKYVDHVALEIDGALFDASGRLPDGETEWDEGCERIDLRHGQEDSLLRMVDSASPFCGHFDADGFRRDLLEALGMQNSDGPRP